LVDVNLWQTTASIFTVAGAIYAYIFQRFEGTPAELPNG
jgi:hypothetical protein